MRWIGRLLLRVIVIGAVGYGALFVYAARFADPHQMTKDPAQARALLDARQKIQTEAGKLRDAIVGKPAPDAKFGDGLIVIWGAEYPGRPRQPPDVPGTELHWSQKQGR